MAAFPVKATPSLHANEEGASVLPLKEASITRPEHSKTATRQETTIKIEVKSPVEVRPKLQVFVRGLLLPKTLCVQVYPETSVSALKKMVQVRSGIQPENQHLYIGRNFQLCDLLSLRDHRIHQDQNIELRAGGLLGGGLEEEHSRNIYFLNLARKRGRQLNMLGIPSGFSVNELEEFSANSPDVPAEIRNRAVYQRALEKGSATLHRTRLMIVGQERVGKTCLMRSLIHASFNSNELSTEGVTTDCTINISSAQSWHCKRGDSTSLKHELMIGLETEKDKHIDMEPLQPTPPHQLQSSSADCMIASQTQTTETQPSGTTAESTSGGKHMPVSRLFKITEKAMSEGVHTQQGAERPTLNIWDFAGQDLYYTTHQTFLSSRAIYLVVFNLCQDLNKPVPVQDEGSGGSITYRTTPIQYLDFWMQSIFTYTKENSSQDRFLEQKSPPIFIVGTHRNSVGGDNLPEQNRKGLIAEIFKRLRHEIHNKPYFRYVVSEFYAVENSIQDNLKIEKLRQHIESIAMEEPYMGERIPLNWLAFDDEKGNISAGEPVMTLNQVMRGFGIEDENELLTMLKFYHDLGHIIYFGGKADKKSQALKDVVILDPQWLIDAFKKILTVKHPRKQNKHYVQSWYRLQENGILEDLLIDHMWKYILEYKQALLDLMDKFDLLCERVDEPRKEEKSSTAPSTATQPSPANASYYVPSMLRQRTSRSSPLETIEKNSNVFYVDFEEFLPDGLYHRLVVRALRWSQDLGGRKPGLLYDRASFYVDDHHQFALQMVHQSKLACIKVSVMRAGVISPPKNVKPPSADVTCKVKNFVKETLQNLKTMWIKRINYCISVQCPNENHEVTHFLPLDECMENPAVVCRFQNSKVVIKTDRFQAMFKQKSSEEESSASAKRKHEHKNQAEDASVTTGSTSSIMASQTTPETSKDTKVQRSHHLQLVLHEVNTLTEKLTASERLDSRLQLPYIALGYFGEEGGSLSLDEYGVHLTIPRGAIAQGRDPQQVYIYVDPTAPPDDAVDTKELALSSSVECGPEGLEFKESLVLSFPHDGDVKSTNTETSGLRMCQDNHSSGRWEDFDGNAVITVDRVILTVNHFSRYRLFGRNRKLKVVSYGNVFDPRQSKYQFRVYVLKDKRVKKNVEKYEEKSNILSGFQELSWGGGDLAVKLSKLPDGCHVIEGATQTISAKQIKNKASNCVTVTLESSSWPENGVLYCAVEAYQDSEDEDKREQSNVRLYICPDKKTLDNGAAVQCVCDTTNVCSQTGVGGSTSDKTGMTLQEEVRSVFFQQKCSSISVAPNSNMLVFILKSDEENTSTWFQNFVREICRGIPEEQKTSRRKEPRLDDKTLAAVAMRLGAGWATLAVELDFTMVQVQTVEKKYGSDITRQGLEMLVTWKQTQSTRVEEQVTTMCTALKNIGRADIAAFLRG